MRIDETKKIERCKEMEKFVVTALEQNVNDKKKGRELWMVLPPEWKGGIVASVAWANSFIDKNDILEKMDHSYYIDQVKENSRCWLGFPQRIQNEFTVFRDIIHLVGDMVEHDMIWDIYTNFPRNQRCDRQLWMNLMKLNCNVILLERLFDEPEFEHICSDREIMGKAIIERFEIASYVVGPLCGDRAFWDRILKERPYAIFYLPIEVIRQCPQLVYNTLKKPSIVSLYPSYNDISLFAENLVEESLGSDFRTYSFVKIWLEAGLPLVDSIRNNAQIEIENFQQHQSRIAEMYLMLARHCKNSDFKKFNFKRLPNELRSDKEFFTNVVTDSPDLFHVASIELQHDADLAALACSKCANALDHNLDLKMQMKQKFDDLLLRYKAYNIFQNFLKHSSIESINHCPMILLPKDEFFVQRLDKDISCFVGVPDMTNMNIKTKILVSAIRNLNEYNQIKFIIPNV